MTMIKITITGFDTKEEAADWLRTYVEKGTGRMDNNVSSGTPVYPASDDIDAEIDEFENNNKSEFKLELE